MSAPAFQGPLRSGPIGIKARLAAWAFARITMAFRVARAVWPIPHWKGTYIVTLQDDVRQVFGRDDLFGVPYKRKLDVLMGGEPFILGMSDTPRYREDIDALRSVIRCDDIRSRLAPAIEAAAEAAVVAGKGKIEVVDELVRKVTFDVFGDYFGVTAPSGEDLRVLGTRLFEFQFADPGDDLKLRAEVDRMAPVFRAHIRSLIEKRRTAGFGPDDVLGRCVEKQTHGENWFNDTRIVTALLGMVVGGPPQPPIVVPQALEQLLRRPGALEGAHHAALANDDALVGGYVIEAMRFDPLAPALPRVALADCVLAPGSWRETRILAGTTVQVAISSAMLDGRRVAEARRFDPNRPANDYLHFGYGLHACFGTHINRILLPLMLKPLLARAGLRRAPGPTGHLTKRGVFAERLDVLYD